MSTPSSGAPPVSVLFVCLGNICRSPAAHAVAETLRAGGAFARFDSAGTGNYHIGDQPNPMSSIEGANRGHRVDHVVRQLHPDDFHRFDLIIGMDARNMEDLERLRGGVDPRHGKYREMEPVQLHLLRRWDPYAMPGDEDLADPWGKPATAYREMYDVIERTMPPLVHHLQAMHRDYRTND
jgi:protein-tyrosine phosphatase